MFIRPNKVVYLPTTFMEDHFDPAELPLNCEMVVEADGHMVQGEKHLVTIKAVPRQVGCLDDHPWVARSFAAAAAALPLACTNSSFALCSGQGPGLCQLDCLALMHVWHGQHSRLKLCSLLARAPVWPG